MAKILQTSYRTRTWTPSSSPYDGISRGIIAALRGAATARPARSSR
jgi:hypothetical protein